MTKTKLILIIITITAYFALIQGLPSAMRWSYTNLMSLGCSSAIALIITFFLSQALIQETLVKAILLLSVSNAKYIPTQAKRWQHLNSRKLDRYTSRLEQLGFVQLMDHAVTPFGSSMARLFAHPEKFYFAQVIQVGQSPMFCIMTCQLEKQWLLSVNDQAQTALASAYLYAFHRHPRSLFKRYDRISLSSLVEALADSQVEVSSVGSLFESLSSWQAEVSRDLGLEVIRDVRAETYFEISHRDQMALRRIMLRKSITWGWLEMFWFLLHPQSEWLGDYQKSRS